MNRREILKQLTVLTGGALSYPTIAAVLDSTLSSFNSADYSLQTFSAAQDSLVIQLTERIIPATDTPGAEAAGVNRFIDHMLAKWSTEKERLSFLAGLNHVQDLSKSQYGRSFMELDKSDQLKILGLIEQEGNSNSDIKSGADGGAFFSQLKKLTIIGYYTSEIGASQELKANLVPGYFNGCMPYVEVGRAWSVVNLI